MAAIDSLLLDLDEMTITQLCIPHDEARVQYHLESNTVRDFPQFRAIIADYYSYHYEHVFNGGRLPPSEAYGQAKDLLERAYRRQRGNIVSAFNNAKDGANGGMHKILNVIADSLKAEMIERYVSDVFDRHVTPNSWEQKVDIIRQLIIHCGPYLSPSIRADQPERYTQNYAELIQSFVEGLRQRSTVSRWP